MFVINQSEMHAHNVIISKNVFFIVHVYAYACASTKIYPCTDKTVSAVLTKLRSCMYVS